MTISCSNVNCVSTDVTSVRIDGNPKRYNVFVSHSGDGMSKEDITLQCTIAVNGRAVNITWFHNGVQNHNLSTESVHFPKNSHVDAFVGTYVCAASTINWEAHVQFRILLKRELTVVALVSNQLAELFLSLSQLLAL